mgnify:CR=1 FL=1
MAIKIFLIFVENLIKSHKFDVVIHVASQPSAPYATSPPSTYYSWQTLSGLVTDQKKLAFSSQAHTGMSAIKYTYCTGTDTCGNCFGTCNINKVLNPSDQCIFDSLSTEHAGLFGSEKEPFTCDHERYLEKSNYVSNSFIKTHSLSHYLVRDFSITFNCQL